MKKKMIMVAVFSLFLSVAAMATIEVTTSCDIKIYTCACFDTAEELIEYVLELDEYYCGN